MRSICLVIIRFSEEIILLMHLNYSSAHYLPYNSWSVSHSIVSDPLLPHGLLPARHLCPWNSPGKNTGVGSHSLLQGIFLTQGSNPCLLHCREILYHFSHQESPIECVYLEFHITWKSSLHIPLMQSAKGVIALTLWNISYYLL